MCYVNRGRGRGNCLKFKFSIILLEIGYFNHWIMSLHYELKHNRHSYIPYSYSI